MGFKMFQNKHGFSLIEIVVAIAIIGVLAAIAVPNFLSWLPNYRLKTTARDLYTAIQNAKITAVKQNACVCANFTVVAYPGTGGTYNVFNDDGAGVGGTACNGTKDGTETDITLATVGAGETLSFAVFSGATSQFCFTPSSVVRGSKTGSIRVRNNNRRFRVTISAAGGVRLERSDNGTNWGY
jgi:prepilin-type N-terminal cleavage/methylation domain-containing protein